MSVTAESNAGAGTFFFGYEKPKEYREKSITLLSFDTFR